MLSRGQVQRSGRTAFVATDVLSQRKCASLCADLEVDVELQQVELRTSSKLDGTMLVFID